MIPETPSSSLLLPLEEIFKEHFAKVPQAQPYQPLQGPVKDESDAEDVPADYYTDIQPAHPYNDIPTFPEPPSS